MKAYWVRQADADPSEAETVHSYDAREAAIYFVSKLEAQRVEFPIARGDQTMRIHVVAVATGMIWDVEVFGDPHPSYDSRILGGSVPRHSEGDG